MVYAIAYEKENEDGTKEKLYLDSTASKFTEKPYFWDKPRSARNILKEKQTQAMTGGGKFTKEIADAMQIEAVDDETADAMLGKTKTKKEPEKEEKQDKMAETLETDISIPGDPAKFILAAATSAGFLAGLGGARAAFVNMKKEEAEKQTELLEKLDDSDSLSDDAGNAFIEALRDTRTKAKIARDGEALMAILEPALTPATVSAFEKAADFVNTLDQKIYSLTDTAQAGTEQPEQPEQIEQIETEEQDENGEEENPEDSGQNEEDTKEDDEKEMTMFEIRAKREMKRAAAAKGTKKFVTRKFRR